MSDKAIVLPASLDKDALVKAIDSVNGRAKRLMGDYQTVGVQALMHLKEHRDPVYVGRLVNGMPKGTKRNSMVSWLLAHGALKVNVDAGTKQILPLAFDKTKETNPEAALADPWTEHMPEKAIDSVFDLSKAVSAIIAKAKAEGVTSVKLGGKVLTPEQVEATLKTLSTYVTTE